MSPRALARLAGFLYIAASVLFIVGGSVRARGVGATAVAVTAQRVHSADELLRFGLAADLSAAALFLCTALALYALLRRVNQPLALSIVAFAGAGSAVSVVAAAIEYSALSLATQVSDSQVALLLTVQDRVIAVDDLFAGLWLLPLGYLVLSSGYFPRVIGALLLLAGVSWLAHLVVLLLAPGLTGLADLLVAGTVGELVFMVWLVIKGANAPEQLA